MENFIKSHEIAPNIRVYTNIFPDIKEVLEVIYEHEKTTTKNPDATSYFKPYRDWYTFGRLTDCDGQENATPKEIIEFEKNKDFNYVNQKNLADRIKNARKLVIQNYCEIYGINETDSADFHIQPSVNFAEYEPGFEMDQRRIEDDIQWLGNHKPLAMNYHTDFEIKKMCRMEENFLLTCNIYWNDDYEGGEIVFYSSAGLLSYKPNAGEVIVFPSGSPYFPVDGDCFFHCANAVTKKRKYFSRNYLMYKHVPTEEMLSLEGAYPRGHSSRGPDSFYDSLFNQLMIDYSKKEVLVHPIVKKLYEKFTSDEKVVAREIDIFD
jgi:hypothetical protein